MPADPSTYRELVAKARALAQAEVDADMIRRILEREDAEREALQRHMEPWYRFVEAEMVKLIDADHELQKMIACQKCGKFHFPDRPCSP